MFYGVPSSSELRRFQQNDRLVFCAVNSLSSSCQVARLTPKRRSTGSRVTVGYRANQARRVSRCVLPRMTKQRWWDLYANSVKPQSYSNISRRGRWSKTRRRMIACWPDRWDDL